MTWWFDDGTKGGQCVRIFDVPGTLSGRILRLQSDLPDRSDHYEVDGDEVRPLDRSLDRGEATEDDSEDTSELLARLPLVHVDPGKHFLKEGKYRSEIRNLTKCQGGCIPGKRLSDSVIQLLGRSSDGQLVFEKLWPRYYILPRFSSLAIYKSWILQLVDGLEALHSVGIVHRDLRLDNIVFSEDGQRLVIIDLESRWGQRKAPEVAFVGGLDDSGWSPKSDIYDLGNCIKGMVYANAPVTPFVEWPVPPPLQAVVEACMCPEAEGRPTLIELRRMMEKLEA
ncbi:hypothetical protein LLEC1_06054 [Akanthomyces lecanii]|uniref:EKC/KEOPS complex subunit BUD32 n=1 Tax=Cordyceps confragosa TaxID=2714763 RepID=A0A179IFQ9_CORDF|nr:hypothetical protein LLEC1_06054 [Akanthomyces lecanii]